MTMTISREVRNLIREYYEHHGEKAKIFGKLVSRDGISVGYLVHTKNSAGVAYSTIIEIVNRGGGEMYATEIYSIPSEDEQGMIDSFVNRCDDCDCDCGWYGGSDG